MGLKEQQIDSYISATERLAVIGSPSSTSKLTLDILGSAIARKLVGELALLQYVQDGKPHYAIGQITEVELRNIWHEDPTMRSLIRQRGKVDPVSERQDTHQGQMIISAVFQKGGSRGYEPSILGTVPATGTAVHLVTDEILDEILSPYREQLFYLGHVYGSLPKLPLWFKHFDQGPEGAGEAYHLGIFGKTGSGKSVLAKMILLAYARYPKMALLVIDPQGEFSKDLLGQASGGFALPLGDVLSKFKKPFYVMTVRQLVLDTWELFEEIIYESQFFERLTMPRGENRRLAASILVEKLQKKKVKLKDLHTRDAFDTAWSLLKDQKVQVVFYRTESSRKRFNTTLEEADPDEFYKNYWVPVAELFREDRKGAATVDRALSWLLDLESNNRPVLVIDLSKEKAEGLFWDEKIQALVIKRLLDGINYNAERYYKNNQSLNALVIIDEAHRLAPRDLPKE
jgi:hypothetical protein